MLNVSSGLYVVSLIAFMLSVVMLGVVAPSEDIPHLVLLVTVVSWLT